MTVRFTPERRQQIERLAQALNCSFVELFERGLNLVEESLRNQPKR
jgi:hypothetical protein